MSKNFVLACCNTKFNEFNQTKQHGIRFILQIEEQIQVVEPVRSRSVACVELAMFEKKVSINVGGLLNYTFAVDTRSKLNQLMSVMIETSDLLISMLMPVVIS